MTPSTTSDNAVARPRVEGDREQEILTAALQVLADVGYDRLTMDSVAQAARASKATLYRRWSTKSALVVDALVAQKAQPTAPDTGTLRGDLIASYCGVGGMTDHQQTTTFGAVLTAMMRDADFAEAFRRDVIGPKVEQSRKVFERARARGEITEHIDLDLLVTALPGIVMQRLFLAGEEPTTGLVEAVVDQIILPAATRGARPTTRHQPENEKDTP